MCNIKSNLLLQAVAKINEILFQVAASTQGVPGLQKPDLALLDGTDIKPGSFGKQAANEAVVTHCSMILDSWSKSVHAAIDFKRLPPVEVSLPLYGQFSCTETPGMQYTV